MSCACQCSTSFSRSQAPGFTGQRIKTRSGVRPRVHRGIRAESTYPTPKAPEGVTVPQRQPEVAPARFGFVDNAERINSRACMIGFFALLIVELVAHKGLLELVGIRTGAGLGFEF